MDTCNVCCIHFRFRATIFGFWKSTLSSGNQGTFFFGNILQVAQTSQNQSVLCAMSPGDSAQLYEQCMQCDIID